MAQEEHANKEAAELLRPASEIKAFMRANRPYYRLRAIETFAERHGLHPSLVLGQLQHRREVSYAVARRLHRKIRGSDKSEVTAGWCSGL
jgi:hypothetical protein